MDQIDISILEMLQHDGRATLTEMAMSVGVTPATVATRIKKLEEAQVIRRYVALLNAERVKRTITAFIAVSLYKPMYAKAFVERIQQMHEVLECFHMTTDMDYLLKVRTYSPATLENIITNQIRSLDGVVRTKTNLILSTAKEETHIAVSVDDVAMIDDREPVKER